MSDQKDSQDDHDPDYAVPGPSDEAHQKLYEENARTNVARKITAIVDKEFSKEIDTKEKEILQIEERLHKALKTLHFLRYVIITDFYNRKQCQNVQSTSDSKQTRIHPAIKQMLGKSPRIEQNLGVPSTSKDFLFPPEISENLSVKEETASKSEVEKRLGNSEDSSEASENSKKNNCGKRTHDEISGDDAPPRKIPRYVPPKSAIPEPQVPSRGARHKVRKRIVVGNISKWIPPDWREDAASHKWTMYVRGSKENAEIADFVGKVRFFLHPSYRPNDVVEVTSPPFHLSRRGWGEFPLRVQLHFKNPLNKPMDIIHYLKLDRTYTGLQTLGSETVVDVWIKTSLDSACISDSKSSDDLLQTIKKDPDDPDRKLQSNCDNSTCKNSENSLISGCNVKIKEEPEEADEKASYVHLEHDYANLPFDNNENLMNNENNVTISHSPPRNLDLNNDVNASLFNLCSTKDETENLNNFVKNSIPTTESILYEEVVMTSEKDTNSELNNSQKMVNGKFTKSNELKKISKEMIPKILNENPGHFLTEFEGIDSSNINASVDVKTMATKLDNASPKLQPLSISIPVGFEALKKSTKNVQKTKQILILKDNKLVPIDSVNFGKVGMNIGRGVSLLKKPPNANSVSNVVKSDGTMVFKLNPKNSLILNNSNNIPALKIAENSRNSGTTQKMYIVEKKGQNRSNAATISKDNHSNNRTSATISAESCKIVGKNKITLGKDRIGTTSKKDSYEEILRAIDHVKLTDVSALVRFVIRRIPLITEKASDPEYRSLHPYACASEKEFLDSNVGKQRALEWYRAKHVKSFLKKKGIPDDLQWSVKEIMIWCRLHGYTPMRSLTIVGLHPRNSAAKSSEKNIPGDTSEANLCTFTEPLGLLEYLRNAKETKSSSRLHDDEIDVIDVEKLNDEQITKKIKMEEEAKNKDSRMIISLGIPEKIVALQSYVTNTARQIGVKLGPEEIISGVTHCAPARLVVRTIQCLLEDLLRSSLAKAWERSSDGGCPETITLEDVRGAILSREEFDVFTNEGLGSHHCADD